MQRSKKFILSAILMAAVLSGSVLAISCSSAGDDELPSAPQGTGPEGDMPPVPGLNDDLLAGVAEILGIDQQELADAFAQAQEEMAGSMTGGGQLPEDMSPEGAPPEDMPPDGMSPGLGLPDELLARVAEILGIDQQELADAIDQVRGDMPAGPSGPPANDNSLNQ